VVASAPEKVKSGEGIAGTGDEEGMVEEKTDRIDTARKSF